MIDNDTNKPKMRGNRRVICHVSDISEAGKGLSLNNIIKDEPDRKLDLFLVTNGNDVHGYFNICPHQGVPLDLKPDTFLDVERNFIHLNENKQTSWLKTCGKTLPFLTSLYMHS